MFRTGFDQIHPKTLFVAYASALELVGSMMSVSDDSYQPDYWQDRIRWARANRELARFGRAARKAGGLREGSPKSVSENTLSVSEIDAEAGPCACKLG